MNGNRTALSTGQLIAILLLLIAFLGQTIPNISAMSVASDEPPHLVAGYTYLKTGDFRLNPQHPPFAKELAALPLLALKPRLDFTWPGWELGALDEWTFGGHFLFKNDANSLLFWARLPMISLGALLCLVVFAWARDWYGNQGGVAALALAAFCPLFLAHSCFVTTDIALTLFWTLTLFSLWRFLASRRRVYLLLCALSFGLALGSKFSAVILVPILPLLLFAWFYSKGQSYFNCVKHSLIVLLIIGPIAFLLVQLLYGASLDPLIYLKGLHKVNADHRLTYPGYLLGDFKAGGYWYYFIIAFLVKTPLPLLILPVVALFYGKGLGDIGCRRTAQNPSPTPAQFNGNRALRGAFLALPALAILIAASLGASNFGVRYILPAYPALIVFSAGVVSKLCCSIRGQFITALLLLWYVLGSMISYPDHLAYFNELVGGAKNGHLVLDDSNIDWGQDLKRLKSYLDQHRIERVKLLYPWSGLPSYYGIVTEPMMKSDWEAAPTPGIYVISTHALIRGLWSAKVNGVKSDWLTRFRPVDRIGYSFWVFKF